MFSFNLVLYVFAVFVLLYLPRIIAWFSAFKKQKHLVSSKQHKIAVLIPARNEGDAVIPLFKSLKKQTYDSERFDVYVIVKEYDDPVINLASDYGFNYTVVASQKSKGEALDGVIKEILSKDSEKFDAYTIVDADCVLEDNYLEEMNNALASGASVINAKKVVRNYISENPKDSNIITASNGLIWSFMDEMGNRFKSDHGLTTMTVTTGIMFTAELVKKWGGWIYNQTMTEDMELERDCAVQGYKTYYTSHTKVYMLESPFLSETNKRRSRWMTGLTLSDFIYAPKLLPRLDLYSLINNYFIYSLWFVYIFVASNLLISAVNIISFLISIPFAGIHLEKLLVALAAVLSIYFAFWCLSLMALIVSRKETKLSLLKFMGVLFFHPVFYMRYILIVGKAIIFRKEDAWVPVSRKSKQSV